MNHQTAFEYVVGTLSAAERSAFQQALKFDAALQRQVEFWEEHLMALHKDLTELPPNPDTWARIERSIQSKQPINKKGLLPWLFAAAAALIAAFCISFWPQTRTSAPNIDYVAVLTDEQGEALLTALTSGTERALWLQWESVDSLPDSSLQLWARSKRDGQVRSLAVFDDAEDARIALAQAEWRLIRDAQELLLTREEKGGSPLGEPSKILLAKGICVRLHLGESAN